MLLEVLRDKHLLAHFFQLEQVDLVVMVELVHPLLATAPLEGQEVMVEMVDLVGAPSPPPLAAWVEQEVMVEMVEMVELEVLQVHLQLQVDLVDLVEQVVMETVED